MHLIAKVCHKKQRVAIKRMAISGASRLENEEQQAEFINTVIRDQVDPDFVPTLTFKDGKGPGFSKQYCITNANSGAAGL